MNFVDKKSTSDTMKKYKFQTIESELAEEAYAFFHNVLTIPYLTQFFHSV